MAFTGCCVNKENTTDLGFLITCILGSLSIYTTQTTDKLGDTEGAKWRGRDIIGKRDGDIIEGWEMEATDILLNVQSKLTQKPKKKKKKCKIRDVNGHMILIFVTRSLNEFVLHKHTRIHTRARTKRGLTR